MRWQKYYAYIFITLFIISALIRLPDLALRPMHGDEAVNAVKFGDLLESGTYSYDPQEYHGPTLYYFTLFSTWIHSIGVYEDLTEFSLRIIPVLFGLLTIVSLFFLRKALGLQILILSAFFMTISPAVVYYNRYYIHETLLVFFGMAIIVFGYLHIQKGKAVTAILTGVFLGLMISTKETWIIFVAAMVLSLLLTFGGRTIIKALNLRSVLIMLLSAIFIFILFYSSFFKNPKGIWDALVSYNNYVHRAASNDIHIHPWFFYLKLLLFFKHDLLHFWSEGLMVVLAAVGIVLVIRKHTESSEDALFLKFIAYFTIVLITIFSLIPYKTPWNLLGFMPGLAILSAFAIMELHSIWSKNKTGYIFISLIIVGSMHLLWQCILLNYLYPASPVNPYVYAHPGVDVFTIKEKVEQVVLSHPEGNDLHIQVIAPNNDYWPLPWYFRCYNRVGWWDHISDEESPASVIILAADEEPALINWLYEKPPPGQRNLYLPLFDDYIELRPLIEYRGYIKKADWDLLSNPKKNVEIN
jgi:uncharacterized protein (TIGR03663 family)